MPKIGAAMPMWAPIETEPKDALPTYDPEKIIEIGDLVSANTTITTASGQDYGSNRVVEEVDEFVSATCAMENNDTTLTTESAIYGSELSQGEDKELGDGAEDVAPYGGLTYFQTILRGGVKYFRGIFHPKVKAKLGADNSQTKAASISFQHTQTTFTIFAPLFGKWRYRAEFATEAEVIAWMEQKLGKAQG